MPPKRRPGPLPVLVPDNLIMSNEKIYTVLEIAMLFFKNNTILYNKFVETYNKLIQKPINEIIQKQNDKCNINTPLISNIESGYESGSSINNSVRKRKDNTKILKHDTAQIPYELLLTDYEGNITTLKSIVTEKKVCKFGNVVIKKTKFSDKNNSSIFVLTLEITMQNYVNELCKTDKRLNNLYVPLINKYFLSDENQEIVMSMEYVNTEPISFTNLNECISILKTLREYNIYHNDTHTENVRQTISEPKQIVLFDWGKVNIQTIMPSSTGLYDMQDDEHTEKKFNMWLNAPELIRLREYNVDSMLDLYGGRLLKKNHKKTKKYISRKKNNKSSKLKKKNK